MDTGVGSGVRQCGEEGTAAHCEIRDREPDPWAGVGVKGGLEHLHLNVTEQGDLCGPQHLGFSSSLEFLGKWCSPPRPKVSILNRKHLRWRGLCLCNSLCRHLPGSYSGQINLSWPHCKSRLH